MKYILTENKLVNLFKSKLNDIRVRIVYDGKDMVYPNGKPIFNKNLCMSNRTINLSKFLFN